MDFQFKRRQVNRIPEIKILEELEKVSVKFNYTEFSRNDFDKLANIHHNTVVKQYGGWVKGLKALNKYLQTKGLELKPRPFAPNRVYSDKELFGELERIWIKVGQRPSRYEWETSSPKISYNAIKERFGGWQNAGRKFIEYKMGKDILADDFVLPEIEVSKNNNQVTVKRDNFRNIALGIRLNVLNRDNFRCVFCGKSPATNIETRLHIDHIIPFSKGGKSTEENLQTLCEECNLGKSNRNITKK